jgi:protein-disulfide isomerase
VYFLFRDFPLVDIHKGALLAAHAANCAGEQDAFWPMHDQLFHGAQQHAWGSGDVADLQTFLGYARELNLDVAALQECVETNRQAPAIEADFRSGVQLGVRSTPSFLINGKLLIGAHQYQTWQRILDDLLAHPPNP